jgi:hypothetical protein
VLYQRELWWLIVVTVTAQGFLPLVGCLWLCFGAPQRRLFVSRLLLVAAWLILIALAGLWIWLPWWVVIVWAASFAAAGLAGWWRTTRVAPPGAPPPPGIGGPVIGIVTILVLLAAGHAWAGRQPPARGRAELEFPLAGGDYLVIDGGRNGLVNSRVPLWRRDRGDDARSLAVLRTDAEGMRARALLPARLERYLSYDDVVYAPCSGRVVALENDLPDQAPGVLDLLHGGGNFVQLRCGELELRLEHLRQGSLRVRRDQAVQARDPIARVGSSGTAGEPHLRFYTWNHGVSAAGDRTRAVTMSFKGRVLTRNDRLRQLRVESPGVDPTLSPLPPPANRS